MKQLYIEKRGVLRRGRLELLDVNKQEMSHLSERLLALLVDFVMSSPLIRAQKESLGDHFDLFREVFYFVDGDFTSSMRKTCRIFCLRRSILSGF